MEGVRGRAVLGMPVCWECLCAGRTAACVLLQGSAQLHAPRNSQQSPQNCITSWPPCGGIPQCSQVQACRT